MKNKKLLVSRVLLVLASVLVPLTLSCAQPAPALPPKPTPILALTPTLSPLAQVIEGIKKEGTVSVKRAVTVKGRELTQRRKRR